MHRNYMEGMAGLSNDRKMSVLMTQLLKPPLKSHVALKVISSRNTF